MSNDYQANIVRLVLGTVAVTVVLWTTLSAQHSRLQHETSSIPATPSVPAQSPQSIARQANSESAAPTAVQTREPVAPMPAVSLHDGSPTGITPIYGPFQTSASVNAACEYLIRGGRGAICERLQHDLSSMAAEPRDPEWAPKMEAKLQSLVDSEKSDDIAVRNVECRTTYCALELVRTPSRHYGFMGYFLPTDSPINGQLSWTGNSSTGLEIEPTGQEIDVSAFTYRRK